MSQLQCYGAQQQNQAQSRANHVETNGDGFIVAGFGVSLNGHSQENGSLSGMGFGGVARANLGVGRGGDWQVANVGLDNPTTTVSAWGWCYPATELAGIGANNDGVLGLDHFHSGVGHFNGSERVDNGHSRAVNDQFGSNEGNPGQGGSGCGDGCGCGKTQPVLPEQGFYWEQQGQQKHGSGQGKIAHGPKDLTFKHVSILAESTKSQGGKN